MRTRAAVAMEAGKPLEVMDVELEGPRAGEVLVEIKATGLCHTDEFTRSGGDPEGIFPAILGHEGAGVVVELGEGVTSLEVGDHVIPLYTPECRECEYCLHPKTNLCQAVRATQGQGLLQDTFGLWRPHAHSADRTAVLLFEPDSHLNSHQIIRIENRFHTFPDQCIGLRIDLYFSSIRNLLQTAHNVHDTLLFKVLPCGDTPDEIRRYSLPSSDIFGSIIFKLNQNRPLA